VVSPHLSSSWTTDRRRVGFDTNTLAILSRASQSFYQDQSELHFKQQIKMKFAKALFLLAATASSASAFAPARK
jgi:hypothetical protein